MEDEVTRLHSLPREDPFSPKSSPSVALPSIEREVNIMTSKELEQLRESCSISSNTQIRLSKEGETIMSARPGEVAFYEAAFYAGLRLLIHLSIRMILHFYNICPAQLVPNAWHSVNPKPDSRWLYFRARPKRALFGEYPSNVKGWKRKFFIISGDNWEFPEGLARGARVPRVLRSWSTPRRKLYSIKVVLRSKTFRRSFGLSLKPMALGGGDKGEDALAGRAAPVTGDKGKSRHSRDEHPRSESPRAMSQRIRLKKLGQKLEESKSGSSMAKSTPAKGGMKLFRLLRPRRQNPVMRRARELLPVLKPGEGTFVNPTSMLGPRASILGSPSMAENILFRAVPLADKERVEQLTLDQTVTKFFHVIGQGNGDEVTLQQGRVTSLEGEMSRTQQLATELEGQLFEARV
ncbi:hypothetical protein Acr_00g0042000 [Actinidia rufa]|uniref:Uncharacterized protein n=1 Tax=Actinidia rufa TaxID=165716 RepID=A0A7J0DI86_9ERIC|nr:hypothetical protein Acr_00g0042000 [Actinidia rufa]